MSVFILQKYSKSCLYLNATSGNDNQQVDASSLFIQQPTSAAMEMYSTQASNAITNDTTATNDVNDKRAVDNKHPQQATTNHKHRSDNDTGRTKTRYNERRNSNEIYEIKNKTVFTTLNRPQQTLTKNKHNGTGR